MNCESVKNQIIDWMKSYTRGAKMNGFVIGVSGGVDSGLVSTLCALTGMPTIAVSMPIHQEENQRGRASMHCTWLEASFKNVSSTVIDLTEPFDVLMKWIPSKWITELSSANTRSRLRMVTLYDIANACNMLVAGTGNKVEDYGIGFFTKNGDGGVDFNSIGKLYKSEVRELAKYLGVSEEVYNAIPTDGLWGDNRSDEQQVGATYEELEWAMKYIEKQAAKTGYLYTDEVVNAIFETTQNNVYNVAVKNVLNFDNITDRQKEILKIYAKRHIDSAHKMKMPPVCEVIKD